MLQLWHSIEEAEKEHAAAVACRDDRQRRACCSCGTQAKPMTKIMLQLCRARTASKEECTAAAAHQQKSALQS